MYFPNLLKTQNLIKFGVGVFLCLFFISPHMAKAQQLSQADAIFVIDTSGSTGEEVAVFQNSLIEAFVVPLVNADVDLHLVILGSDTICLPPPIGNGSCPGDENLPGYRHVTTVVGSNDALTKILSTYDQWKDSLRSEATKTFVVLSDSEATMSADDFNNSLLSLDPTLQDYKFNGIVDDDGTCGDPGTEYLDLITLTNGRLVDICDTFNIPAGLTLMAQEIIDDLASPPPPSPERETFTLKLKESKKNGIVVVVKGKLQDANPEASYSAEVTLVGGMIDVVKDCGPLSSASPVQQEKNSGVDDFLCEFDETKKEIFIRYKALNQGLGTPYSATLQITRGTEVVITGQGTTRID